MSKSDKFSLENKVAIVTGGASGIGYEIVSQCLAHKVKGITLIDSKDEEGRMRLGILQQQYGKEKVYFVKIDVSNMLQIEESLGLIKGRFGHVDIIFHCAAIFDDVRWPVEVTVNVNGVLHCVSLGADFVSKYKSGDIGHIVVFSSDTAFKSAPGRPIYNATKSVSWSLARIFGHEMNFARTRVKVIAICAGPTETQLMSDLSSKSLNPTYYKLNLKMMKGVEIQQPEDLVKKMLKVLETATTGSCWIIRKDKEAFEYVFSPLPNRSSIK